MLAILLEVPLSCCAQENRRTSACAVGKMAGTAQQVNGIRIAIVEHMEKCINDLT